MPARKPAKGPPNLSARRAINWLAMRVSRAMAHDLLVVVQLAGRDRRKLTGRIVGKRVRPGWQPSGEDPESPLEFDIVTEEGCETVRLDRVMSIERKKLAPDEVRA